MAQDPEIEWISTGLSPNMESFIERLEAESNKYWRAMNELSALVQTAKPKPNEDNLLMATVGTSGL